MIEVYERKQVRACCATCLYGPGARYFNGGCRSFGCGHADHKDDWAYYAMTGRACGSYFLDHRFERAR